MTEIGNLTSWPHMTLTSEKVKKFFHSLLIPASTYMAAEVLQFDFLIMPAGYISL